MANVHGLFSGKKKDDDDDDDKDDSNNRYVGGIGDRGGGSGLAVEPNPDEQRDAIFGLAQSGGGEGGPPPSDGEQTRRIITMYRGGFTIDDGPYRRLDDAANADFLRALATGRTPPELSTGNIEVGLVDKRSEDYVETFQSFSGTGASLGTSAAANEAVFPPNPTEASTATPPPAAAQDQPTIRIAVRLPNGRRHVVTLAATATVQQLAQQIPVTDTSFTLTAGFPPRPLTDPSATVEAAGLKGAQVSVVAVAAAKEE